VYQTLTVRAAAKINLGLTVHDRRHDGFHEIESVMQQVSLADYLTFQSAETGDLSFSCSDPNLTGDDNLVYRAARLLAKKSNGALPGVRIRLSKIIPVAAGLAGGSADAAATLKGLNEYWQLGFSMEELLSMGAELGSDVPFCLQGGTALAEGRGEILTKLPAIPFFWVVLALPRGEGISSAAAYRSFNREFLGRPDLASLVEAIRCGSREAFYHWFSEPLTNTLETADLPQARSHRLLWKALRECGLKPLLSGSGPTLFMFFDHLKEARSAVIAVEQMKSKAYLCWT
jgi:4-diphosphocytidyl-2-C-methyl-D-erythritol kinase